MYKEALTKNGFNDDIIYTAAIESTNLQRNKTRNRKIIWFNPAYSMDLETNIGETFLKLVKKSIFHAAIVFIRHSTRVPSRLVILA